MTEFEVLISAQGTLSDAARLELTGFEELDDGSLVVLRGTVPDQPALLGLLERFRREGLRIRDVERLSHAAHSPAGARGGVAARLEIRGLVADLLRLALHEADLVEEGGTTTLELALADEDELFEVLAGLESLALDVRGLHVRPVNPRTHGVSAT